MPDQVKELVHDMEKGDVETRRKAGEAMGALNDPRAVAPLSGSGFVENSNPPGAVRVTPGTASSSTTAPPESST